MSNITMNNDQLQYMISEAVKEGIKNALSPEKKTGKSDEEIIAIKTERFLASHAKRLLKQSLKK